MVSERGSTETEEREGEHAQLHARYRRYLIATAVVSLLVGGVIGALGFDAAVDRPIGLTPPPSWLTPVGQQVGVLLTMPPTVTPRMLHVYVSGAVAQPQVVTLPEGSLVAEAIEAAGGALPASDLNGLNLAAPVRDHDHILVPGASDEAVSSDSPTAPVASTVLVDINTAPVERLDLLPGIGPTRAAEIVAYREGNGPFTSTDALLNVPGIGPGIYADIKPWITVE